MSLFRSTGPFGVKGAAKTDIARPLGDFVKLSPRIPTQLGQGGQEIRDSDAVRITNWQADGKVKTHKDGTLWPSSSTEPLQQVIELPHAFGVMREVTTAFLESGASHPALLGV
jgi:hypothetical protein